MAANGPPENFKDVSGSGYRAYQTVNDTALLKNGIGVDIEIIDATGNGTGPFPQREWPDLLTRLRQAVLAGLR